MAINAIEFFWQGQEYHGPENWQQYKETDIDILDFLDTTRYLLYLGIQKYMISMIPTLLKQGLRKNQHF